MLNYLDQDGTAQVYWVNTADNSVITRLFARAEGRQREELWGLASGGEAVERLNLNTVFSDLDRDPAAVWGQLYLTGHVTTDDVALPNDADRPRRLRVPNREVAKLYRMEIASRARNEADASVGRTAALQDALAAGDAKAFEQEMRAVLLSTPSHLDLA